MKHKFRFSSVWFLVAAFTLCVLAFGRWVLTIGYIWDDFPISWILHEYGMPGLLRYFSIDRPLLGSFYQVTSLLFHSTPFTAHLFALVARVASAFAFWALLRLVWPEHKGFAWWSALLFLVYPGFSQQYVAIIYGNVFLLIAIFFASLSLTVLAVRRPQWFWWLSALSLALSALNLFIWEYFFLLDALRPVLVWWVLGEQNPGWKSRLRRVLQIWLPYLVVFLVAIYWRNSVVGYQTYQPVLLSELKAVPWKTLLLLGKRIFQDSLEAGFLPWWKAVQTVGVGSKDIGYWLVVVISTLLVGFIYVGQAADQTKPGMPRRVGILLTCLGIFLLAGGPFWLIGMDINLYFSNDRFVLPYMWGGSLLVVALLTALPLKLHLPLLAILVGLSTGVQYYNGVAYRGDWEQVRRLFWQLSWRAPSLEPHTSLLLNDNAFTYYTDNSLSAPLNWIYQPEPAGKMDYILLYPSIRLKNKIPPLTSNQAISVDYRSGRFTGSMSQVLVVTFQPPGCLRVLDPEIEGVNTAVQPVLLQALPLSDTRWILPEDKARIPQEIFGAVPAGTWCEIYEKADLARQLHDWPAVTRGWESAQTIDLWPQDAVEYLPFVEAYAHSGAWETAQAISRLAAQPGSQYPNMVCRLWARIERETVVDPQQEEAIRQVRVEFNCE